MAEVLDKPEVKQPVENQFKVEESKPQSADPLDSIRMDDTRLALGKDTAKLHHVGFEDSSKSDTKLSLQDLDKPENANVELGDYLKNNGMPADNQGGRRDAFLAKVLENSAVNSMREQGYLKEANPTTADIGRAIEAASFDQSLKVMGGIEGMKDELKMPADATPEQVRKLFTPEFFKQMAAYGAKDNDYASVWDMSLKSGMEQIKAKAGIKD